jgi:hypothetical protein
MYEILPPAYVLEIIEPVDPDNLTLWVGTDLYEATWIADEEGLAAVKDAVPELMANPRVVFSHREDKWSAKKVALYFKVRALSFQKVEGVQ